MLGNRDLLILSAAPAGLALASALWLLAAPFATPPDALQDVAASLAARPPGHRAASGAGGPAAQVASLIAHPLLETAPSAAGAVKLEGVSLTPGDVGALIAEGQSAPQWLRPGDRIAGVTLRHVGVSSITVEGVSGEQELALGQDHGVMAPPSGVEATRSDLPVGPTGARPLPPNSAYRVRVPHDPRPLTNRP